jgi:hypothetical protein
MARVCFRVRACMPEDHPRTFFKVWPAQYLHPATSNFTDVFCRERSSWEGGDFVVHLA